MPPRPTPKRAPSPPRGTNRVGGERKFRLEVRLSEEEVEHMKFLAKRYGVDHSSLFRMFLNNEWWELERQKRGF